MWGHCGAGDVEENLLWVYETERTTSATSIAWRPVLLPGRGDRIEALDAATGGGARIPPPARAFHPSQPRSARQTPGSSPGFQNPPHPIYSEHGMVRRGTAISLILTGDRRLLARKHKVRNPIGAVVS